MIEPLALVGEGLRRAFPRSGFQLAVERIEAPAGQTLVLLGPSGSGKTTLLHLLGLLDRPDAGRVLLGGREVTPADRRARLQLAAVFQRPYLFKGSVAGNVAYGLAVRGVARSRRGARVAAALACVGLAGYEQRSAAALSGGEAQRVSLARALVLEPRVLLLDEPLANLDPPLRRRLARDFAAILRQSGATAVWVTHDQDEALVVADRLAIMNGGRIQTAGPTDEVIGLPADAWTAAFLGVEEAQPAVVVASRAGLVELRCGDVMILAVGAAPPGAPADSLRRGGAAMQAAPRTGARVQLAVRPEDVLLFAADVVLPATDGNNQLAARVVAGEPRGATHHVVLDVGGARFAAAVSRATAVELGIAPGVRVIAVFKAAAVNVRLLAAPAPAPAG